MNEARLHPAGEHLAVHAATDPDRPALVMAGSGEARTYRQLDEASTRLAGLFAERGLAPGDHLALLLPNGVEFFEAEWAGLRSGLYVTPINWHLTAAEARYIASDCAASAIVTSPGLAPLLGKFDGDLGGLTTRFVVGGAVPGFEALEDTSPRDLDATFDEVEGTWMFYSSGTTGRPKGVKPPLPPGPPGAPSMLTGLLTGLFGFSADTVYLSPAPLYHAAAAGWTVGTQRLGGTAVVMEHFDPIELLAAIEGHRVTHLQLVPTHLIRLLKLPEAERNRFDLSSLQLVAHAAAPCPVETKRAALDWLGPIVHEFYSGSEGAGFCHIGAEDWLAHPGSVGRSLGGAIHILDDHGTEVAAGGEGQVWFETNRRFEYHGDPAKTAMVWNDRGWSTLGDVGRVDGDGYLYLTDRASNMIISGGVNIYPREAEDVLVQHPGVADVAVIAAPHADMGEQVTAVVQLEAALQPGDDRLAAELVTYCRERLSHFKCPRAVRFVPELPRLPSGKLVKRLL